MSLSRLMLAGLIGGIAMFIWGAVAHMALPLGDIALKGLPAEAAIVPELKKAISQHGVFMIPSMGDGEMSEADEKAWEEKYRAGPRGLLIYDPSGGEPMSISQLGAELLSNVLAALLLAVVLSGLRAGPFGGTIVGAGMGLFAWLSIDVSYWNWYRFPSAFTCAAMIEQMVGGLVTGLAVALVLRRKSAPAGAGRSP